MISISSQTFDLAGSLVLQPLANSRLRGGSRRVSRRQLLDGTVSIYDGGFSEGDRDLVIYAHVTEIEHLRFESIAKTYSRVTVSTRDGCYQAAISSWSYQSPALAVTLFLETRLDE